MRSYVVSHALAFVAGFSLVFVILFGVPATLLGNFLFAQRDLIAALGGLLIILLGLHMAGFFRLLVHLAGAAGLKPVRNAFASLNRSMDALILPERRWQAETGSSPSYLRSLVVGVTFAAGWTPCIGPLLGLVLTLAAVNPGQAMPLLVAYSAGLAAPFLITAALLSSVTPFLRRINRFMNVIELVSGILLVLVGVLLVQGTFSRLNVLFSATPAWLENVETGIVSQGVTASLPLSFLAGLLSFLSPCVLPLVPVYLGYLSGTVLGSRAAEPDQVRADGPT